MHQPKPKLPYYFRTSKRLKSLDEWEDPAWEGAVRFDNDDRVTLRGVVRDTWRWLGYLRPLILLAILLVLWTGMDPALVEPPEFLSGPGEQVSQRFTRCGPGRGHACVIDGDTFKLGQRSIRIIGIDAPETHPSRCTEEARLGEQATAKLQALLNEGSFEMVAPVYRSHDMYGRDLRVIRRKLLDGTYQSIATDMRASGLAHRYAGGLKWGWC
jgi:hypothetical protein